MSRPETEAQRLKLIRLIHVARRELGQDEPTYRTMLLTAGKAASTTQMGVPALRAVVEHAKRCGFKVRAAGAVARAPERRQDGSAQARKVRALWLFLHHLGVVRDPSERALAAYVKRQAKVDDLHWAHERRLVQLIEALKAWALRELPMALLALQNELAAQPPSPEQAQALLRARQILQAGAGYDGHLHAWVLLQQALGRPLPPGLDALPAPAGAQGVQR